MKIFFKVWNVLLFIAVAIPAGIIFLKAFGYGLRNLGSVGTTEALVGFDFLIAVSSLILAVTAVIMTVVGLIGNYGKCSILAFVVLILDLITMVLTRNFVVAIVQIVMLIVHICLAKILQKNQ